MIHANADSIGTFNNLHALTLYSVILGLDIYGDTYYCYQDCAVICEAHARSFVLKVYIPDNSVGITFKV